MASEQIREKVDGESYSYSHQVKSSMSSTIRTCAGHAKGSRSGLRRQSAAMLVAEPHRRVHDQSRDLVSEYTGQSLLVEYLVA